MGQGVEVDGGGRRIGTKLGCRISTYLRAGNADEGEFEAN